MRHKKDLKIKSIRTNSSTGRVGHCIKMAGKAENLKSKVLKLSAIKKDFFKN